MTSNGYTVSFGRIEKGPLFAIKKQIRAYLRTRLRGEELAPPRIWEDERRITFPGWPREAVIKALEYATARMESSFRTPNPDIREATLSDLGQREAADEDAEVGTNDVSPSRGDAVRDATWTQHLIDKTTRDVSEAYEEQLRRERAKTASLESRVGSLIGDRDRLQREKEDAEKARRSVEVQNDNLIKSMLSFADDPSKAALQIVGRAASWIRRLEVQARELGDVEPRLVEDCYSVAKRDLLSYVNEVLGPTGKRLQSIDELARLTDATPWEDTEFHKSRSSDYLKAKEELEFVSGIESGVLRVPDSVRDLIIAGLPKPPREITVQEFESRKQEHQAKRDAAGIATQAERAHTHALRVVELIANRAEKDPVPIAVIYHAGAGGSRIEVRLPSGLDGGPLSDYLERSVRSAADKAGFKLARDESPGQESGIQLIGQGADSARAELLRRQGAFREELTAQLAESPLRLGQVTFRILDIRDFQV